MADNEIRKNLVYLTEHLTNLDGILIHLFQDGIITRYDREEIESENIPLKRNDKLLNIIQLKDWPVVRDQFIEILKLTNNEHCADKIEGNESGGAGNKRRNESNQLRKKKKPLKKPAIRKCEKIEKWWPDERRLIESLHKRKHGDKLLVEEVHERIKKDKNRMVVICESPDAAKYSGMGGIGKTLTATWYAHHYEDFYEHILWIDCGEGSLLTSFKKLARDLEIKNRNELIEAEEFARKCFQSLNEFKCLWIYDNAESYKEKEGIIRLLPKNRGTFFCLVTSRSRNWGIEDVGYGKISDLQLGIFSQEESLDFLRTKLKKKIKFTEYELNELCRLLGNLPLALQLALAALNRSGMDVKTYIEKSKFVKVLDAKFDDYEKTINGNVKVSLSLIQNEEDGRTANEILTIFGYIRPDEIELEFFQSALLIEDKKMKQSLKLLTKYSLVAKKKIINFRGEKKIFFNIHRLLQQVIRHNGKEKEKETLRKILGCDGFIDYKLLPFTKYADEDLKKEFPKVKAELLDQDQLRKLRREKRFDECVQLARFIDQELKRNATKLNYAICLHENGQLEECVETAEELLDIFPLTAQENIFFKAMDKMLECLKRINLRVDVKRNWDLMELEKKDEVELKEDIGDLLLFSCLQLGKFDKAIGIAKRTADEEQIFQILTEVIQQKKFEECVQLAKFIDQEIKTNTTKLNYAICLDKNGELENGLETLEELYEQQIEEEIRYESFYSCLMKLDTEVSRELVGGHMLLAYWRMENSVKLKEILEKRKQFSIIYSEGNLEVPIRLVHSDLINSNYSLTVRAYSFIDFKLNVATKKIELWDCPLSLNSFDRLSPEELTLYQVSIFRDGREVEDVKVNGFLDLTNIKRLNLRCDEEKKNLSLELSGDFCMEYLELENVRVLEWNACSWNVKEVSLIEIPFVEKTSIKVQEMTLRGSSLDVSCLPHTIKKMTLGGRMKVFASGGVDMRDLNFLRLLGMEDDGCLSHFHSAPLTHIHLDQIKEVNVDLLPQTLTHLQITSNHYDTPVVGGVRKVDKLILDRFSFKRTEECLSHLQTDNLVIHYINEIEAKDLLHLMFKHINTVAVGEIKWDKEQFQNYSSLLDREAAFYFLEGGRGRAMDKEEFDELMKLF